jgi:hypothetical protein
MLFHVKIPAIAAKMATGIIKKIIQAGIVSS